MPQKAEPKISTAEAVLVGLFLLILDAIDLIPFAGDLTDVAAAPLLLYYHMKHINGVMYGIAWVLDLIPATQEFPSRTIVWIGTVAFDRFAPAKVEQAFESVGEVTEGGGSSDELEGETTLEQNAAQGAQSAEGGAGDISSEQAAAGGELEAEGGGQEEAEEEWESRNAGQEREEGEGEGGEEEEEASEGESEAERAMEYGSEINPEEEAETRDFALDDSSIYKRDDSDDEDGEPPSAPPQNGRVVRFEDIKKKQPRDKAA